MCYGTGNMDRPTALVQVNVDVLKKWADDAGIAYGSPNELCENTKAEKYVKDDDIVLQVE